MPVEHGIDSDLFLCSNWLDKYESEAWGIWAIPNLLCVKSRVRTDFSREITSSGKDCHG